MDSATTKIMVSNNFKLLLIAGLLFVLASGCKTKYFTEDIYSNLRDNPQTSIYMPDSARTFRLTMNNLRYFKNNVEERVMMTDMSRLRDQLVFFQEDDPDMPQRFHQFEILIDTVHYLGGAFEFKQGQPVIMVSKRGKTLSDGRVKYDLVKAYLGHFLSYPLPSNFEEKVGYVFYPMALVDYSGDENPGSLRRKMDNISAAIKHILKKENKVYYENGQRIKRDMSLRGDSEAFKMEAFVGVGDTCINQIPFEYIEFQALLDYNHNQIGAEKPMIFDFRQIYGEPLWLVRRSDKACH
jgi:hypothetical protein